MTAFPQHQENVKLGRCSECGRVQGLVGHWGPLQERKLCAPCDEQAWRLLLAAAGRVITRV